MLLLGQPGDVVLNLRAAAYGAIGEVDQRVRRVAQQQRRRLGLGLRWSVGCRLVGGCLAPHTVHRTRAGTHHAAADTAHDGGQRRVLQALACGRVLEGAPLLDDVLRAFCGAFLEHSLAGFLEHGTGRAAGHALEHVQRLAHAQALQRRGGHSGGQRAGLVLLAGLLLLLSDAAVFLSEDRQQAAGHAADGSSNASTGRSCQGTDRPAQARASQAASRRRADLRHELAH